eukprot:TRINITY_DN13234_c0_g1_i1.p1 TRINITY_DN13234_c0_g1~~TRINITY_DN13234_c0_g1_i1.p1  ORF type:complete len:292 (+),score=41.87 TRINITY_DN13234_c0_g1_i1:109-876(+)
MALGFLFGIIVVAGTISLAPLTRVERQYSLWRVYNQPEDAIQWPDFIMSFTNQQPISVQCTTYNGKAVPVRYIEDSHTSVYITASDHVATPVDSRIKCTVDKSGPTSWQIIGLPRNNPTLAYVQESEAEIDLHKSVYNYRVNKYHLEPVVEDWSPRVFFRYNPNPTPTTSTINLSISNFAVHNYQEVAYYNSWQCYADIGGLVFMSVIFHRFLMFFIGIAVPNDSRIFGGVASPTSSVYEVYEPIPDLQFAQEGL